jgi:hypothetical protein
VSKKSLIPFGIWAFLALFMLLFMTVPRFCTFFISFVHF